jgi:ABC-type multidrug transport system fused ATPase/permease subunit
LIIFLLRVSGTLRSNLDPFGEHEDATLWDALRRSYLVENTKTGVNEEGLEVNDPASQGRFTLDSSIEDEGANLSLGQVRAVHFFSRLSPSSF